MKLFRDRSAAHHLPPLQHQRLESAFRQIKRSDQSIVSAANNRYTLSDGHGQFAAFVFDPPDFHSFKITWLAIRPFAPIIPPPGCVADPHI